METIRKTVKAAIYFIPILNDRDGWLFLVHRPQSAVHSFLLVLVHGPKSLAIIVRRTLVIQAAAIRQVAEFFLPNDSIRVIC